MNTTTPPPPNLDTARTLLDTTCDLESRTRALTAQVNRLWGALWALSGTQTKEQRREWLSFFAYADARLPDIRSNLERLRSLIGVARAAAEKREETPTP